MMNLRVAGAIVILLAIPTLASAEPCAERTRTYSWPFGDPVLALCCTEGAPPVVVGQALVSPAGPVAPGGPVVSVDPATEVSGADTATPAPGDPVLEIAGGIQERLTGQAASCRRFDSLTTQEKLKARLSLATASGGGCRVVAGQYDHFVCECNQTCDRSEWACNCPGVEPGMLPKAAPDDFPQDSYRSRPELVARTCNGCSPGSTCCP